MVPAHSHKVSRVSWYSGSRLASFDFAYGAFTLFGQSFQDCSAIIGRSIMRSEPRNARIPVWALSISLAATLEIDFSFFSSGYLDVSVHRVADHITMYSLYVTSTLLLVGSPIRKSPDQSYLLLPEAYRCSSRPSSASSAKASAMRPY